MYRGFDISPTKYKRPDGEIAWHPIFTSYCACKHNETTTIWNKTKGVWRQLKPNIVGTCLYPQTSIKGKFYLAHIFILECFVGFAPDGLVARHKNDDKTNYHIGNLEWGTRSENEKDKIRNGTLKRVLTDEQILDIQHRLKRGVKVTILASIFKVSTGTIYSCKTKKVTCERQDHHRSPWAE